MCLAAMVFTLPILMVNFGQISIISPIANIVVVPLIPLIMLFGFVSVIGTFFSSILGIWLGFPTWMGLSYILHTVEWFGELPFATIPVQLGEYAPTFEIGYFLVMTFLVLYFRKENE